MRLLNTSKLPLQFEEVPDADLHLEENQYAILSHRWGRDEDEITYQDILSSADVTGKSGFAKIKEFCKVASKQNCRYGWVDTCCINKGNSAELTEAINSMYLWYKCSKICIAYLKDVLPEQDFTNSEWFDRGWTLQELVAPKLVTFYNQSWGFIGTKMDFLTEISARTRIPPYVLSHAAQPNECSVAQRMSWAANRVTTRVEDRAYSLMGLFDVHMPMIYGEREKAFLRLQQNIVAMCKDESLFAWAMEHSEDLNSTSGLYAPSPSVFRDCADIVPTAGSLGFSEKNGELPLSTTVLRYTPGTWRAMLNCTRTSQPSRRVGIMIAEWQHGYRTGFVRVMRPNHPSQRLFPAPTRRDGTKNISFPIHPSKPKYFPMMIYYGFMIRTLRPPGYEGCRIDIISNTPTSDPNFISQDYPQQGNSGVVRITPNKSTENPAWSQICWIKFGFTQSLKPCLWLANDTQSLRLGESFELALKDPRSKSHYEAVNSDMLESCKAEKLDKMYDGWPEGRLVLRISEDAPKLARQVFVLDKLNLKVSLQLQSLDSAHIPRPVPDNGSVFSDRETPMKVWAVDITTAEEEMTYFPKTKELTPPEHTGSVCSDLCFSCYTVCCPWVCLILCCDRDEAQNDIYYPTKMSKRRENEKVQREKDKAKQEYLDNAHSHLPLFEAVQIAVEPGLSQRRNTGHTTNTTLSGSKIIGGPD